MKRIKYLLLCLAILLFALPLCSCSQSQVIYLNVYNWGEYIGDDVNASFEEYFNENLSDKYGGKKVKVLYSNYATNEDMYSKLKSSAVSYDIVIPSDYMIQKMIAEDMLIPFDAATLENYGNIKDEFKNLYYDENNLYSVPYTYGMLGIIYNKKMVSEEDLGSWDLLWNEKYAGNILQFNNPRDAFATAMYREGLDVNSTDVEVWEQVLEIMKEQKPYLQGYVSDEIFNKMENESALIAPYYVGDFLTMQNEQENLAFYYPEEGTNYFIDAMCIPTCSKNIDIAKEYINFMLSEEVAVENAEYIGYASPNRLVEESAEYKEYMENEYAYEGENGESAYDLLYNYLPADVNEKYNALFPDKNEPACYRSFDSTIQRKVNSLWEELKMHGSTEPWVHTVSLCIVGAVLVFAVYTFYVKKMRSRKYRMRDKEATRAKKLNQKT